VCAEKLEDVTAPGEADAFRELARQKVVPVPQKKANVVKTIVFWLVVTLAAVLLWEVVKNARAFPR
jgi:hypothetical protein